MSGDRLPFYKQGNNIYSLICRIKEKIVRGLYPIIDLIHLYIDQSLLSKGSGVKISFGGFSTDPIIIDRRLKKKLTRWEFGAIAFSFLWVIGFILVNPESLSYDFSTYTAAVGGDYRAFYYAPWILPIVDLINKIPYPVSFFLWDTLIIAGVFIASRVFGGNAVLALISYQMSYILFQGQIIGLLVGMLAVFWWAIAHKKWYLAGIFFIIAAAKFQSGLVIGIILFFAANISWKNRAKILVIPAVIGLLSLVIYPGWPIKLIANIQNYPPNDLGSIAIWQWIGPFALIFWLPPFLMSFPIDKKVMMLGSAAALGLPYFQQTDLITLFVLPIGWLSVAGNIGYLSFLFGNKSTHVLAVIPLTIYFLILIPALFHNVISNRASVQDYPKD